MEHDPTRPMTHDEFREWTAESLRGNLPEDIRAPFEMHRAQCAECQADYNELREAWGLLSRLPEVQPPPAMRARFRSVLAAYDQGLRAAAVDTWQDDLDRLLRKFWPARPMWQAALALVLLGVGLAIGTLRSGADKQDLELAQLRGEMQAMSRMLAVSLLQQRSASERLKGVSMSSQLDQSDDEVVDALLEALKSDPNVNVRLAALDALAGAGHSDQVRDELMQWLPRQSSPLVQLAMVDLLGGGRDARVESSFTRLLGRKDLNPAVRERVRAIMGQSS